MLASGQYALLADALAARGVTLRTSGAQYRQAHELPGWHPALASVAPAAAWTAGDGEPGFRAACERLGPGPAVLRDYVKWMKHYWHEAAYIPDVADHAAAWRVAARFREPREDEFTRRLRAAPARGVHVGGGAHVVEGRHIDRSTSPRNGHSCSRTASARLMRSTAGTRQV
jgi:hypothetical protein